MHVAETRAHLERQDTVTITTGSRDGSCWINIRIQPADPASRHMHSNDFELSVFCRDQEHMADVLESITNTSFNAFIRLPVEQKIAQATVLAVPSMVQETPEAYTEQWVWPGPMNENS